MVSVKTQVLNFDEIYFISPFSLTLVACLRKYCHKNFTPRINSFSRRFISSSNSGLRSILSYIFLWVRYQFNIVPLPDNIKVSQYHSLKILLFSECASTLVGNQVTTRTNVDFYNPRPITLMCMVTLMPVPHGCTTLSWCWPLCNIPSLR